MAKKGARLRRPTTTVWGRTEAKQLVPGVLQVKALLEDEKQYL